MKDLYRFGISLEKQLIEAFDRHIERQNYHNRSEAIRDLIRKELSQQTVNEGGIVAGAIIMTYNHHKRELVNKLLDIQHDFQSLVISTQHIHLDHHYCLEILAVNGKSRDVEKLANSLKSQVGVKQVELSVSAAD